MLLSSPSLGQRFHPRHNALSVVRLALAGAVALVHAQSIGWRDQPHLGRSQIGELAVDGFFVISGFLVARSASRLPTLRRFVWHRALRILPGFWTCLLMVAFVAAPLLAWLQGRSLTVVLSGADSTLGYVTRNAALLIRQWDIAGLTAGNEEPAIDGSLWTLFYEALCYVTVGLLAAAGLLRRAHRRGVPDTLPTWMPDGMTERHGSFHLAAVKVRQHAILRWTCHTACTSTTGRSSSSSPRPA